MTVLELGYKLLQELNIKRMFVLPEHLEIRYKNNNTYIIAFGNTEEEVIENFYDLYEEAFNKNKR